MEEVESQPADREARPSGAAGQGLWGLEGAQSQGEQDGGRGSVMSGSPGSRGSGG